MSRERLLVLVTAALASCTWPGDFDEFDSTPSFDACVPETERCDGADNDCDSDVDEDADADCALPNAIASCAEGACRVSGCAPGYDDCDSVAPGCESPIETNRDHCGGCDIGCFAEEACEQQICQRAEVSWGAFFESELFAALTVQAVATDGLGRVYFATLDNASTTLVDAAGEEIAYPPASPAAARVHALDAEGNHLWTTSLEVDSYGVAPQSILATEAGDVFVSGHAQGSIAIVQPDGTERLATNRHYDVDAPSPDAFVISLRADGTYRGATYYGGVGHQSVTHIASISGGRVAAFGYFANAGEAAELRHGTDALHHSLTSGLFLSVHESHLSRRSTKLLEGGIPFPTRRLHLVADGSGIIAIGGGLPKGGLQIDDTALAVGDEREMPFAAVFDEADLRLRWARVFADEGEEATVRGPHALALSEDRILLAGDARGRVVLADDLEIAAGGYAVLLDAMTGATVKGRAIAEGVRFADATALSSGGFALIGTSHFLGATVQPDEHDLGGGPIPRAGGQDLALLGLDGDLSYAWARVIGGQDVDTGEWVAPLPDGAILAAGYHWGTLSLPEAGILRVAPAFEGAFLRVSL